MANILSDITSKNIEDLVSKITSIEKSVSSIFKRKTKENKKREEQDSKNLESIDSTLKDILKLQKTEAKKEDKRQKKADQEFKRRKSDKGLGDMLGITKKDKDKTKKSIFQSLVEGIAKVGGLLGTLLTPSIKGLGGLFNKFIGGAIEGLGKLVTSVLGDAIKGLGGMLRSVLMAALKGLAPAAAPAAGTVAAGAALVLGGTTAGNAAQRALSNQVGGRGKTKNGTTFTFENIVDLRNQQKEFAVQKGISGEGLNQSLKGYDDLLARMKISKSLNDQLYDKNQLLQNEERQVARGLPGASPRRVEEIKQEIKDLNTNLEQSREIQEKQFEALKVSEKDIERATLARRKKNPLSFLQMTEAEKKRAEALGLQNGGPITVPGSGSGDKVPFMLPPGSFVLNREASKFQSGGNVPALLEPGERVYAPGDWGAMEMMMNDMIPRFQKGGEVSADTSGGARGTKPPTPKPTQEGAETAKGAAEASSGKSNSQAILAAAEKSTGLMAGIGEQCANSTRAVLKLAGSTDAGKTTKKGDLDPEGLKYNAPSFAASFAGSDMGTVKRSISALTPGDIMLWRDTYGNYAPGAITHVGIAGEGNSQYDHGRATGWRKRSRNSLANKFAYGITLGGTASGGGGGMGDFGGGGTGGLAMINPMGALSGLGTIMDFFGDFTSGLMEGLGIITGGGGGGMATGGSAGAYDIAAQIGASKDQWDIFRNTVAQIESGGKYDIAGGSGGHYDGRYQLGAAAKTDASRILGQKDPGHSAAAREAFRKDSEMQEKYFAAYTKANHNYLMRNPAYASANTARKLQILGYAHNQGMGGAEKWLTTGQVGADGFGTKGTKYTDALASNFKAAGYQQGGVIHMKSGGSPSAARFKMNQEEFARTIAEAASPQVIVVPGGGGGPRTSPVPTSTAQVMPPELPDGPSSIQAAEYFYRLNLGSVY